MGTDLFSGGENGDGFIFLLSRFSPPSLKHLCSLQFAPHPGLSHKGARELVSAFTISKLPLLHLSHYRLNNVLFLYLLCRLSFYIQKPYPVAACYAYI